MVAVAYYNMAVEYEYLNDLVEAINSINQASTVAKLHLGKEHYLTFKIRESKSKISQKKKKVNHRLHSLRAGGRMRNLKTPYGTIKKRLNKSYYHNNREHSNTAQENMHVKGVSHHIHQGNLG
jgi:hypothetical protein